MGRERLARMRIHLHLHRLPLSDLAESRLGDERAHVEARLETQRHRGLPRTEQRTGLHEPVQDDGIARRPQFGLAHDDVGLGLDALRASEFGFGLPGLPLPESLLHEPQALRRCLECRLRAFDVGRGPVEIALGPDPLLAQHLLAREFLPGQRQRRDTIDTFGFRGGDLGTATAR